MLDLLIDEVLPGVRDPDFLVLFLDMTFIDHDSLLFLQILLVFIFVCIIDCQLGDNKVSIFQ